MFSILKFLDRLTVFSSPFNFWQPFWVFLQDFHFYKTSKTKPQRLTQRFVVEIGNWTFGGDWRLNLRLVPPADFKKFPSWAERGHWEKRVQKDPWKNGIFAKMKPINISHSYRQIHQFDELFDGSYGQWAAKLRMMFFGITVFVLNHLFLVWNAENAIFMGVWFDLAR